MNANRTLILACATLVLLPAAVGAQSREYREAPPLPEPGSEQVVQAPGTARTTAAAADSPVRTRTRSTRATGGLVLPAGTGLWRGPGAQYPRLRSVRLTTNATVLSNVGGWRRVRLVDGSIGWLSPRGGVRESAVVGRSTASSQPAERPAVTEPEPQDTAATGGLRTADDAADQTPSTNPQQNPSTRTTIPPVKPAVLVRPPRKNVPSNILASAPEKERKAAGILEGTKPDPMDKTQDSPAATLGDAWKMLLYLAPMLIIIVLTIRALKGLQQKAGKAGALKQGILGGFNLANARKIGGSNIRLVESVPVGSVSLHLVEVRGKLLLLGGAGATVNLLAEFENDEAARNADFQSLLRSVSTEIEAEEEERSGSFNAVVNSLEEQIRQAREAMMQSAPRTRPWNQEAN
jgi:flagellar biogenesis protein FliO